MTHIDPTTTLGRAVALSNVTRRSPQDKANRRRQLHAHLIFAAIYIATLAVVLAPRSLWMSL